MFRLSREIRFALNELHDEQLQRAPTNSYAGYPSLTGHGRFLRLQVTLEGKLDPTSGYLRNIKEIDLAVRERVINGDLSPQKIFASLRDVFAGHSLHSIALCLSPFLILTQLSSELPMTRLSQKFEFSAAHRLHNPKLSEEENRKIYGKCNNPNGHGHNYEVQVTLRGKPKPGGLIVEMPAFEKLVKEFAIDRLDHKHLNLDVPEFAGLIPTVENIAMIIHRMLKSRIAGIGAELASVTVWETPKTWCEYAE